MIELYTWPTPNGHKMRPAVKCALEVLAAQRRPGPHTEKEREILFGKQQYQKR